MNKNNKNTMKKCNVKNMESNDNLNYSIYACFGRSFDSHHKQSGKIHLTSSIWGSAETFQDLMSSIMSFHKEAKLRIHDIRYTSLKYKGTGVYAKYVFIVSQDKYIKNYIYDFRNRIIENGMYDTYLSEGRMVDRTNDNRFLFSLITDEVTLVFITLHELTGTIKLASQSKDDHLFDNIFGKFDDEKKNSEAIFNNSLFIFRDCPWWYIVLLFKVYNVNISGGRGNKRHIINPVEIQLINFINILGFNAIFQPLDKSISRRKINKWDNLNLSNKIPLNDFEKIKISQVKLNELKLIQINEMFIKSNADTVGNTNIDRDYYKYLIENVLFSFSYLREIIYSWFEIRIRKLVLQRGFLDQSKFPNEYDDLTYEILSIKEQFEEIKMEGENFNLNQLYGIFEIINEVDESSTSKVEKFPFYRIDRLINKDKKVRIPGETKSERSSGQSRKFSTINTNRKFLSENMVNLKYISGTVAAPNFSKTFKDPEPVLETLTPKDRNISAKSQLEIFLDSDDNLFLDFFKKIIIDSKLSPKEKQYELEYKWGSHLLEKMNELDNRTRNNLGYVIRKADETLKLTLELKQKRKKYPSIYQEFNKRHLLLAYSVLCTFYARMGFTAIAMKIGNEILWVIYYNEWKTLIKSANTEYLAFNNFIESKGFKQIDILKIGLFFIEIFCNKPTDIFVRSFKDVDDDSESLNDKELSILIINEDYFEMVQKNLIITPLSLPMLCKPNKWSELETEYGGFLENKYNKNSVITGSFNQKHTMENKKSLLNAVNTLNSNKFKINTLLLNFLENEGFYILERLFQNLKNKTDRNQSKVTLKIAKTLAIYNQPFYINHSADWRGRIYTNSFYLSYQGGDLANSLLNFFEGMELTEKGKEYLYIYGANCYNENNLAKKSFEYRCKWVKSNLDKIINLDKNFLLKAKNLVLFTSFCLVMRELDKDPNYKVHLPIFLDATCSGIQHIAALIKDLETGKKVNLIPQKKSDTVGDIYSDLLEPINKAINEYGENHEECFEFKKIKLSRQNIKQPIMTKVYNVSIIGIAEQLRDSLEKKVNIDKTNHYLVPTVDGFIKLNYREIFTLAEIINAQIFKSLPSLKALYVYLKEIVIICLNCNVPLTWFTPTGLKINQLYPQSNQYKVSITFKGKSSTIVLREITDKVDSRKQINAIIPNIIHSLDASHLINIVNRGLPNLKYPYILTIHDCFGAHPNNIDELKDLVTTEFVNLYKNEDFLKKFHHRILQNLKDNNILILSNSQGKNFIKVKSKILHIPDLPKSGELIYNNIRFSQYFIN